MYLELRLDVTHFTSSSRASCAAKMPQSAQPTPPPKAHAREAAGSCSKIHFVVAEGFYAWFIQLSGYIGEHLRCLSQASAKAQLHKKALAGGSQGAPSLGARAQEAAGFQMGSGRAGFSQKGHESRTFWCLLFYVRTRCHILPHFDTSCSHFPVEVD